MDDRPAVLLRLDGGSGIGSGHVVRCAAVASELGALGVRSVAVVSTCDSASMARARGLDAVVVGGDPLSLGARDAEALASLAGDRGRVAALVDSYGAGDAFWDVLGPLAKASGVPLALIDDRYLFGMGLLPTPRRRPVGLVVSYGFDAVKADYEAAYRGSGASVLVGPRFAPVRPGFSVSERRRAGEVSRVLVTTGSTNPGGSLERLCAACALSVPGAVLDVVVGSGSSFDETSLGGSEGVVHRGLSDLAPLMRRADLAVSAGGSTLYELACMGVPTVAVPVVENQEGNVRGFDWLGCGLASSLDSAPSVVARAAGDRALRERLSVRGRSLVDGRGAKRIARALASLLGAM